MKLAIGSPSSRWRGLVLGAWAAGLAVLLIADRYSLFIRAQLWPLLLASLVIVVLFLISMMARPGNGGRIQLASWIRGGMLLLPLLFMGTLISGAGASGLNSFALKMRSMGMDQSNSMGVADDSQTPPTASGATTANLGYICRHARALAGTSVVTEGRVSRDDALPSGEITVYRFVVVCCAADAMPVQVVVKSNELGSLKNDDWIRVTGKLRIEGPTGQEYPVIDADNVTPIDPPDEPYLSPYHL